MPMFVKLGAFTSSHDSGQHRDTHTGPLPVWFFAAILKGTVAMQHARDDGKSGPFAEIRSTHERSRDDASPTVAYCASISRANGDFVPNKPFSTHIAIDVNILQPLQLFSCFSCPPVAAYLLLRLRRVSL
jgi:hypothetical protein